MLKKIYKSILFKIINNALVILFLLKIRKKNMYSDCDLTLVIFSKDRSFQLRSLLLSIKENFFGLSRIIVVYKASSMPIMARYKKLATAFKSEIIYFFEEKEIFKKSLNKALLNVKTSHIIFSVDDILVFDQVNFKDFKHIIKDNNIFSLRLGTNINFCYTKDAKQSIPNNYKSYGNNIISWKISDGKHDFAYPFSLDMHVFSSKMIKKLSNFLFFNSINSFEGALNIITKYVKNWHIYSFNKSKCVNLPFNKVQNDNNNKFGGFDYNDLDEDYDNGLIYDFKSIKIKDINSPHQILDVPKINIILNNYNI